jgi:SAM-dependent methyltransferase
MLTDNDGQATRESVRDFYNKVTDDGRSCGCGRNYTEGVDLIAHAQLLGYRREDIERVPQEALMGLGSGNPLGFVEVSEGQVVVDLGSGAGLDSFLVANKVGARGSVIGIDMTEAMVRKARAIAERYGYENVNFSVGTVENLPLDNDSVDIVVSNCVLNLTVQKLEAFKEAYRILKPGGSMAISDMVADGELSQYVKWCFESWTGCVAGLVQKEEYCELIREAGFNNPVVLRERSFQKFGVGGNSGNEIKSIQVKAEKM